MENENPLTSEPTNPAPTQEPSTQPATPAPQPGAPGALPFNPTAPAPAPAPQVQYPAMAFTQQPAGVYGAAGQPVAAPGADGTAWQQIVTQQQQQIDALMAQNAALNGQVVSLVQGGGQLNAAAPQQPVQQMPMMAYNPMFPPQMPEHPTQIQQMMQLGAQPDPLTVMNPPSLSDSADYSMESLAEEIGKPKDAEK